MPVLGVGYVVGMLKNFRPSIAKQRICRNVVIHGYCRYENKGCEYNHDTVRSSLLTIPVLQLSICAVCCRIRFRQRVLRVRTRMSRLSTCLDRTQRRTCMLNDSTSCRKTRLRVDSPVFTPTKPTTADSAQASMSKLGGWF